MLQVFKYLVILWICSCLTVMHQNMDWKLRVSTGGFFCRVTRWAPGLLVGGTHISIFAGLFSKALFLSLETFLLVSCLGKRNIHEVLLACVGPHAVSKQVSALGGWLGKRCPSLGRSRPMGTWLDWKMVPIAHCFRRMQSWARVRLEEQSKG